MKKLMIAASAALCATVGFSDVTSANIVGYQGIDSEAKTYPAMGFTFKPVGASSTCPLKNFTADGMDPDGDALQVLNPANTQTIKNYTYFSKATAEEWGWDEFKDCIGWWEVGNYGDSSFYYGDEVIKAGQGFILLNGFNHEITVDFPSALDVDPIKDAE